MKTQNTLKNRHLFTLCLGFAAFLSASMIASGFAGGDGGAANPYQVATAEHLDAVRDHLDAHFIQNADIDNFISGRQENV